MRNYKVLFYKAEVERNEEGKEVNKTYKYLGSTTIDDVGVDNKNLTLTSKAFRRASDICLLADKVTLEQL